MNKSIISVVEQKFSLSSCVDVSWLSACCTLLDIVLSVVLVSIDVRGCSSLLHKTRTLNPTKPQHPCYSFSFWHLSSSLKAEHDYFDPYDILGIPSNANSTVIRSQFRRLSLKYHPDKNPGHGDASYQFNQVSLAYKALSDRRARHNWITYGHPDGYRPWKFDVLLPAWLRPRKGAGGGVLGLYLTGYLVCIIGFVVCARVALSLMDPDKRKRVKVTEEDVQALMNNLDNTSSVEDVLECLAACPQLCSEQRRQLALEMAKTTGPVRSHLMALKVEPLYHAADNTGAAGSGGGKEKKKKMAKGEKGQETKDSGVVESQGEAEGKEEEEEEEEEIIEEFYSRGRRGEGNRRVARSRPDAAEARPDLSEVVSHNLVVLLSALWRHKLCVEGAPVSDSVVQDDVCGTRNETGAGTEGDEMTGGQEKESSGIEELNRLLMGEQQLVLGLAEPLLEVCMQLAARKASLHLLGTVVEAKALLRRRLCGGADDPVAMAEQEREMDKDLDAAIPRIKVDMVIETWGESQIAVGDTVTATITVLREHAKEYQGRHQRRPTNGFLKQGEPWWVMVADGKGDRLIGVTPLLVDDLSKDTAECK
ncbi:unnamed protein product, partial [Choristocarpus tenellus]